MSQGFDLKVRRMRARITQKQLADALGVSRVWVSKLEIREDPLPAQAVSKYEAALSTFEDVRRVA